MDEENKIRKFFAEVFIDKKELSDNNISYPIKLEYYKIANKMEEYGVEIVKKEFREEFVKVEHEVINKITKEEERINGIIHKLKENIVTPVGLKDTLDEILNNEILNKKLIKFIDL